MKKFNSDERLKKYSELLMKYSYPWAFIMTIFVMGMLLRYMMELDRTGWYNITTLVAFSIVLVIMFTVTSITLGIWVTMVQKQKEKEVE